VRGCDVLGNVGCRSLLGISSVENRFGSNKELFAHHLHELFYSNSSTLTCEEVLPTVAPSSAGT
jgi:hypothetical protein